MPLGGDDDDDDGEEGLVDARRRLRVLGVFFGASERKLGAVGTVVGVRLPLGGDDDDDDGEEGLADAR